MSKSTVEADIIDNALFIARWGMTRDQFSALSAKEITDIATARGLSVAGIARDGEFNVRGDGKDKRN